MNAHVEMEKQRERERERERDDDDDEEIERFREKKRWSACEKQTEKRERKTVWQKYKQVNRNIDRLFGRRHEDRKTEIK